MAQEMARQELSRLSSRYFYRDADGNVVFVTAKTVTGRWITIRPSRDTASGWAKGRPDELVPYNLRRFSLADEADPIIITEGERDCETAASYGWPAITNPFGAASWPTGFNEYVAGRNVLVVVDCDRAGLNRAVRLKSQLESVARSVTVVWPPCKFGSKADLTDHEAQGLALTDLALVPDELLTPERPMRPAKPAGSGPALPTDRHRAYAAAVVDGEIARLTDAPQGDRNVTLNACAFRLYRYVVGGELPEEPITELLRGAASALGCGEREVRDTLASAMKGARSEPKVFPSDIGAAIARANLLRDQFVRLVHLPWGSAAGASVLLTVLDAFMSDPDGVEAPGIRNLVVWSGTSDKVVEVVLERCRTLGLITLVDDPARRREMAGRGLADRYRLDVDLLAATPDPRLVQISRGSGMRATPNPTPPCYPEADEVAASTSDFTSASGLQGGVGFHVLHERSRAIRNHDAFCRGALGHAARLIVLQAPGHSTIELEGTTGLSKRTLDRWLSELCGAGVLVLRGEKWDLAMDWLVQLDGLANATAVAGHRDQRRAAAAREQANFASWRAFQQFWDELIAAGRRRPPEVTVWELFKNEREVERIHDEFWASPEGEAFIEDMLAGIPPDQEMEVTRRWDHLAGSIDA